MQNFGQPAAGSVHATVTYSTGGPAPSSYVQVNGSQSLAGFTDSSGNVTINGVPLGTFTAKAQYPGNYLLTSQVSGTLVNNGDTVSVSIVLPPAPGVGSIAGQIRYARGTAGSGLIVIANSYDPYYYISTLVLNAGISKAARIADYTVEDSDNLFATNVRSPFFLVQHLVPVLGEGSTEEFAGVGRFPITIRDREQL